MDTLDSIVAARRGEALAQRLRPGVYAHLLLGVLTSFATDFYRDYPRWLAGFLVALIVASAFRFVIAYRIAPHSAAWRGGGNTILFATLLLSSIAWGGGLALVLSRYPLENWNSVYAVICTMAVASAIVVAYSTHLALSALNVLVTVVPGIVAIMASGSRPGLTLGAATTVYVIFLLSQVRLLSRHYSGSIRNEELLRLRADELEQAKLAAEQASLSKTRFVANISHEIRTPMNGVLGMLSLILDSKLDARQRDFVDTAKHSAESLLHILNDVLDFSKIEVGRMDLLMESFALPELLDDVRRPFELPAASKGLEMSVEVPQLPALVGDPGRLRQVLVNLIGNALKFTESGGIAVRVAEEGKTADTIELHFTVADTGTGIAPGKLDAIFEAFVQADSSGTRRQGGTGLGLSICQKLVELMGGRIWLESEVGAGSVFHFTVALKRASEEHFRASLTALAQGTVSAEGLRILLVEDNAVNQKVAVHLLEKYKHKVDVAQDGLEALAAFDANKYDLVLMDLQMPKMDGLEATRAIRQREQAKRRHTPIVGLTASAMREDRTRCLEAGMDAYLAKPVRPEELHATISKFCQPGAPGYSITSSKSLGSTLSPV